MIGSILQIPTAARTKQILRTVSETVGPETAREAITGSTQLGLNELPVVPLLRHRLLVACVMVKVGRFGSVEALQRLLDVQMLVTLLLTFTERESLLYKELYGKEESAEKARNR